MLPLAAIAVGACSEKDEPIRPSAVPATPGAAIDFSVAATPGSRTYYTDDKYQMDWLDADEIHLFSDKAKAQTGTNLLGQAQYQTGNVAAGYSVSIVDGHDYHANLSLLSLKDNYPLQWPDKFEDTEFFTFFGAYPLSRKHSHPNTDENSLKYEMYYMTNQRVSVNTKTDGEYTTIPDMKNAYLMARDTVVPIGQHVLLHFNPIMTTIDVHIHAHSDDHEIGTGIINGMKITGVSVIMPKRLKHGNDSKPTFTYDLAGASNRYDIAGGKLANDLIDKCPQAVYVGIDNGSDPYVMLNEGESLSLMAFLPPVKGDDMTGTKVKIHTAGAYDFVVTLPSDDKKWIEEGRIDIDLPKLDPDRNLGNAWMKNLPGDMAMTHLSLPGASCVAGTTAADVTRWLRAGVRVLDMCKADKSEWDSICVAVDKFLDANRTESGDRTEFVMVWGDGNGENSDFTKKWIDKFGKECAFAEENAAFDLSGMRSKFDVRTVAAARKLGVLVLKKGSGNILNVAHGVTSSGQYINTTNISRASDIKISSAKWNITGGGTGSSADSQVYYINDGLNLDVAKHLASARNDESTGCAGIIMIPFAGQAFDSNLNQVYGDVLLQTVIDCNYKFIIDLK